MSFIDSCSGSLIKPKSILMGNYKINNKLKQNALLCVFISTSIAKLAGPFEEKVANNHILKFLI